MTRDELAARLHGRQYGAELSGQESWEAYDAGLLVVFGASDDLVELGGFINEELGARDGTEILIGRDGTLVRAVDREDHEVLVKYGLLELAHARAYCAHVVRARWGAEPGVSWTYETDLPHATFEVREGDEVYCRGLVIELADVVLPAGVA